MAAKSGRDAAPLNRLLLEEPFRFEFFQAVRLLEWLEHEACEQGGRRRQPVGYDYAPCEELARFRALPSHSFPAGEISQIERIEEDVGTEGRSGPLNMVVGFFGLTGPQGVLPEHYTSLLIERLRQKDFTLRDFLDLFHHRTISLFYRAWEKYRFPFAYERAMLAEETQEDLFTRNLYCLVGFGTGGLRNRFDFADAVFLFYAGHFAHFPRSAVALEQILSDFFGLSVRVEQFRGQWLTLSRADQSALAGGSVGVLGQNNRLGSTVVLGERVWDVEGKFRVRLGPLSGAEFREFFPQHGALQKLCQLVRVFVGRQFDFEVQPVLRREDVPWCALGTEGPDAPRLGWNTWIHGRPLPDDADDAVFTMEGLPWSQST